MEFNELETYDENNNMMCSKASRILNSSNSYLKFNLI